ncbi:MAG: phosphoribosylglycinamide formyltransferase [Pelagibacterales bacterium]|jgi:phosphoribosylglycinamide formyltransferase-1|nr:phosphoribosylglycinamide formyltransferase [Pelagibacterales bacterium]MBL6876747.1 phosphoribosylglycinamide formyltransferase [Flavobacteriales bacterium]
MKKKIVIFISGKGSNALNIINYFSETEDIKVSHVYSNNKTSAFLKHKFNPKVNIQIFENNDLKTKIFEELKQIKPDLIVLAGFLKKIPLSYIEYFENRIINIHPSLLPSYGGKGMYGAIIHDKVMENNEKETGITIHYVSEHYDSGQIIFQKKISIEDFDTAKTIEEKIHKLEYEYYPKIIETVI